MGMTSISNYIDCHFVIELILTDPITKKTLEGAKIECPPMKSLSCDANVMQKSLGNTLVSNHSIKFFIGV